MRASARRASNSHASPAYARASNFNASSTDTYSGTTDSHARTYRHA